MPQESWTVALLVRQHSSPSGSSLIRCPVSDTFLQFSFWSRKKSASQLSELQCYTACQGQCQNSTSVVGSVFQGSFIKQWLESCLYLGRSPIMQVHIVPQWCTNSSGKAIEGIFGDTEKFSNVEEVADQDNRAPNRIVIFMTYETNPE